MLTKFGVRYSHGKILFYKVLRAGNPEPTFGDKPGWAVDIREIIAMFFVGIGAIYLLSKGDTENSMHLLIGLLAYATGRTVPGGK